MNLRSNNGRNCSHPGICKNTICRLLHAADDLLRIDGHWPYNGRGNQISKCFVFTRNPDGSGFLFGLHGNPYNR
jgi:hypothetical protein